MYMSQVQDPTIQGMFTNTQHVRTENSPMQKSNHNQKQLRSKQLMNAEERLLNQKINANFSKDYID